jgi:mono/diheme cytochrome c family protein
MRAMFALSLLSLVACGGGEAPKTEAKADNKAEAKADAKPAAGAAGAAGAAPAGPMDHAALMALGEKVYKNGGEKSPLMCVTCHQENGEGVPPSFPPLKGSQENMGSCTDHAKIVIKGLTGEIKVQGVPYNGAMPAQGDLSNEEIAAVLTYERNSWGNNYGDCTPEQVAAAR